MDHPSPVDPVVASSSEENKVYIGRRTVVEECLRMVGVDHSLYVSSFA